MKSEINVSETAFHTAMKEAAAGGKSKEPSPSPHKMSERRFARATGLTVSFTPKLASASEDAAHGHLSPQTAAILSAKKSADIDAAEKPFSFFSSLSNKGAPQVDKPGEKDPSSQRRTGSIFSTPTNRSFSINPVLSSTMSMRVPSPGPVNKSTLLQSESSESDVHSPLSTISPTVTTNPIQPSPPPAVQHISRSTPKDSIGNTVNPLRSAKSKAVGGSAASSPAGANAHVTPPSRPRPPAGNSALAAEIVKNLQKARNNKGGPGSGGGRLAGRGLS